MKQNIPFIPIRANMSFDELGLSFISSAFNNNLEQIKSLLNHYYIPVNYNDKKNSLNALSTAASQGNIEIVKYLLTSSELKEHANIHHKNDNGYNALMYAATWNHTNIVSYLLTSSELKEHSHLLETSNYDQDAFIFACMSGAIDVVKYLIESKDLDFCINPHYITKHDMSSIIYAYKRKQKDILKYLLLEKNIIITKHTLNWIQANPIYSNGAFKTTADLELKEMIEDIYYNTRACNLMKKLENKLSNKNILFNLKKI